MSLMKEYYDFTGVIFTDVWNINIIEFFQTIAFIKEYKKREEEKMKQYMKNFKQNG